MTTTDAPSAPGEALPRTRSRHLDAVVEIAITVILAVGLYLVIQTFLVGTYRVEQVSMLPTLEQGQHLLVDKLSPRFDPYSRGDIVVFHAPGTAADSIPYIKRVIGVAGDHVALQDGEVSVNGVALDEPYLADDGPGDGATEPLGDASAWDVPAGQVFVMGDHRARSVDSRSFGPVAVDQVIGRAWIRFWPLESGLGFLDVPRYPGVPDAPAVTASP
ncbi:MAG: signal peptidase I [Candidatus Limnocylindrales bacterium]